MGVVKLVLCYALIQRLELFVRDLDWTIKSFRIKKQKNKTKKTTLTLSKQSQSQAFIQAKHKDFRTMSCLILITSIILNNLESSYLVRHPLPLHRIIQNHILAYPPLPPYNTKSYFDIPTPPPATYRIIIERPLIEESFWGDWLIV